MSIKIEISDSQRKPFIDFLKSRETAIQLHIQQLQEELVGIKQTLLDLSKDYEANSQANGVAQNNMVAETNHYNTDNYSTSWTQAQKVEFVLRKIGRPAGSGEIADIIIRDYEPAADRVKTVSSVSSVLTNSAGRKKFKKSTNERNQFVYSL